jgi:protein phosphatase
VICSDGLTAHVEDEEILALAGENSPQQACDLLVDLTLDRGAVDNVTVVAVRFDPAAAPTKRPPYLSADPPSPPRFAGER